MPGIISTTQVSNIYTKGIAEQYDPRQNIGELYTIPNEQTRILSAKLLMEECLETIKAMGISVSVVNYNDPIKVETLHFAPAHEGVVDLISVIDGCCDTKYVATGILTAFGVPDQVHQDIVNLANMRKFPNMVATIDKNTGKYLKPAGWMAPEWMHTQTMDQVKIAFRPTFLHFGLNGEWKHDDHLNNLGGDVLDFLRANVTSKFFHQD